MHSMFSICESSCCKLGLASASDHPHLIVTLVMTLLTLYRTSQCTVVANDFVRLKHCCEAAGLRLRMSPHRAFSLSKVCITAGRLRPWPQMLTSHAAKLSAELRR